MMILKGLTPPHCVGNGEGVDSESLTAAIPAIAIGLEEAADRSRMTGTYRDQQATESAEVAVLQRFIGGESSISARRQHQNGSLLLSLMPEICSVTLNRLSACFHTAK